MRFGTLGICCTLLVGFVALGCSGKGLEVRSRAVVVPVPGRVLTEVVVLPRYVTLESDQSQQFIAYGFDQDYLPIAGLVFLWTKPEKMSGDDYGSLSPRGFYTAPRDFKSGYIYINATATYGEVTKEGHAIVNMVKPLPPLPEGFIQFEPQEIAWTNDFGLRLAASADIFFYGQPPQPPPWQLRAEVNAWRRSRSTDEAVDWLNPALITVSWKIYREGQEELHGRIGWRLVDQPADTLDSKGSHFVLWETEKMGSYAVVAEVTLPGGERAQISVRRILGDEPIFWA